MYSWALEQVFCLSGLLRPWPEQSGMRGVRRNGVVVEINRKNAAAFSHMLFGGYIFIRYRRAEFEIS